MKKLIATICAIVMVMALAVPAFAAGSPAVAVELTGSVAMTTANVSAVVTAAAKAANPPARYVPITAWLVPIANADGSDTLGNAAEFGRFANGTLPAGMYLLQIVLPDGTLGILDLSGFAVDANGNIVIPASTLPTGCAFRLCVLVTPDA